MEAPIDGKAGDEGIEQELLERLEVKERVLLERQEMERADIAWKWELWKRPLLERQEVREQNSYC